MQGAPSGPCVARRSGVPQMLPHALMGPSAAQAFRRWTTSKRARLSRAGRARALGNGGSAVQLLGSSCWSFDRVQDFTPLPPRFIACTCINTDSSSVNPPFYSSGFTDYDLHRCNRIQGDTCVVVLLGTAHNKQVLKTLRCRGSPCISGVVELMVSPSCIERFVTSAAKKSMLMTHFDM